MIDLKKLAKEIVENKKNKGFNTTDMYMEFGLLYGEVAEAFEKMHKKKDGLGEELADVMIYLIGICEMEGVDIEEEVIKKHSKNINRESVVINGVPQHKK